MLHFFDGGFKCRNYKKAALSPEVRCTLKGGEAVYITLDNLIQIGIFLTGFTVMIFSIISFVINFTNKKK